MEKILRDDLTADTDWLAHSVGKLVWGCTDNLSKDLVGISAVVADGFGSLSQVIVARNGIRLSVITGLDRREGLAVIFDELRQAIHQLTALNTREISPGWIVECGACSLNSGVNILLGSRVNGGDLVGVPIDQLKVSTAETRECERGTWLTYAGLMLAIFSPVDDFTH